MSNARKAQIERVISGDPVGNISDAGVTRRNGHGVGPNICTVHMKTRIPLISF